MTPEQIVAIEARLAAATPGPWEQKEYRVRANPQSNVALTAWDVPAICDGEATAEFIAHAPADIRALLDANAMLAAEVAALRQAGRAVLAEHDARAAYIAAGSHNAPDGSLRAAMAAHAKAEGQIDAAAAGLRAAGFDV